MSLQQKYQPVLDLSKDLDVKINSVKEENNVLKVDGLAKTQYLKNCFWDKAKEIGGTNPADFAANIKVEVTDYFHLHTVKKGETLSEIAKEYLGAANKYMDIFNMNKDVLKNPDLIHVGDQIKIPNP
jgi:nucleoid-associated protein YgaU